MNRTFCLLISLLAAVSAMAVPALRQWRTVTQPDGSSIELMLVGDENLHYYVTRDQVPVVTTDGVHYCYARVEGAHLSSSGVLAHDASLRGSGERALAHDGSALLLVRSPRTAHARPRATKRVGEPSSEFTGSRRAVVILAQFSDKPFAGGEDDALTHYNAMLNQHGFNTGGAKGSVNDYFADMSRGVFDLQFDIYGPVRVSKSATYYGGPSPLFGGFDYAGEFVCEAIERADTTYNIDWTPYDWNGDGEVEQVFVLYSGYGQATGGPVGSIWPHAWTLTEAKDADTGGKGALTLDGLRIDQYACGNELYGTTGSTTRMGMGVFCHEFSHCMGLPDMYDTKYGGNYGMDNWDLLDHGSYNGPNGIGECPAAWTSYERHYAGWLDYTMLQPGDSVSGMTALTAGGNAYIIYNDGHPDEYYLLENRRHHSWDSYTPEEGLLIIHVDYDSVLWLNNIVNTEGEFWMSDGYTADLTNDHPRMTPFHKLRSLSENTYYDTYPIVSTKLHIDSLTDRSKPAAMLYNANTDGSLLMHKPITSITKAANGDISFVFMAGHNFSALPGDVNGDGVIDIADVNIVINVMLGKDDNVAADVNGDGKVDIADVNAVINVMLGKV